MLCLMQRVAPEWVDLRLHPKQIRIDLSYLDLAQCPLDHQCEISPLNSVLSARTRAFPSPKTVLGAMYRAHLSNHGPQL
jgi:hypothetical protein